MTSLAAKNSSKKDAFFTKVHADVHPRIRFIFWLAILIQLVDIFVLRFNRTAFLSVSVAMYLVLAVLSFFTFREHSPLVNPKQIILFIAISAFYVLVPFFLYAVPKVAVVAGTTLFDWVSFFLAILPIWPIYIGLREGIPFVHKYVNFWIVFLLILFIFGMGFNLRAGSLTAIGGRPEVLQAGAVTSYLWEKTVETARDFWDSIRLIPAARMLLNATGINYYTGMIDNNEKAPVGLYIDNVRLADEYAYEGYPAVIWADIQGKSFVEEIVVEPSCYIEKVANGIVEPSHLDIFGEEHDTLSCTFSGLQKGSYTAKVGASFNFETWAYVTYTFVDIDTKRSLEMQGKNVNYELDIDPLPNAVFTNGPVMLGMASMVDQPIGVDTAYNTKEPVLGVTLDNLWTDPGNRIKDVTEFIIQVPDDFRLVKCDRWPSGENREPFKTEEGYRFYRFTKNEIWDPRVTFQSVTCRLQIEDPAVLLEGAQKVQRTFVAQAKYKYNLEKSVRLYVRE